jgi:hypothetical protein
MVESLREMSYGSDFLDDELQAYLSTSSDKEIKFWFGDLQLTTKCVVKKFKQLYKTRIVE